MIQSSLLKFFEQAGKEFRIRKILSFIVGVPNSRAQIKKWIGFLYLKQREGIVPLSFDFQHNIHYPFREAHEKSSSALTSNEDVPEAASIIYSIMQSHQKLISAIEELRGVVDELLGKFQHFLNNKKVSFYANDCEKLFLARTVQFVMQFILDGEKLKEYLRCAQTIGAVLLSSPILLGKDPKHLQKMFYFLGSLLGKIGKPEFSKVEVEYEGVGIAWSGFASTPLDEL